MGPSELRHASLLRRSPAVIAALFVPFVIALTGFILAASTDVDPVVAGGATVGSLGLITGFLFLALVRSLKIGMEGIPGELRAGPEGVSFQSRKLASRDTLSAGFLIPVWGKPPLVRLEQKWPRRAIEIEVANENDGRAVLSALGFDASQSVASFRAGSMIRANALWATLGTVAAVIVALVTIVLFSALVATKAIWLLPLAVSGALALLAWLVTIRMPTRVWVGADGVMLSWFFRKRFVEYGRIGSARPFGIGRHQGAAIWTVDGEEIRIPVKPHLSQEKTDQQTDLIVQRIQQALMSYHQRRGEGVVRLPERGTRPFTDWIRALRAAGSGGLADHRTSPVATEDLWRIVEDPANPAPQRSQAAVALGSGLDETGKTRLRIAAEATVAPELRRVLELAAEEAAEAELAEALERLSRS